MSKHEWAIVVAMSAFAAGFLFRLGWLAANWATGKSDATFHQHIGRYVVRGQQ